MAHLYTIAIHAIAGSWLAVTAWAACSAIRKNRHENDLRVELEETQTNVAMDVQYAEMRIKEFQRALDAAAIHTPRDEVSPF